MPNRYSLLPYITVVTLALGSRASAQRTDRVPTKDPAPSHDRKQKDSTEDGMSIQQFYKTLGSAIVYSTKHAVKIYSTGNHIVIVSRAPKWDVIQYSMTTKKYCEADLGHTKPFMQRTFALFSGNVLALAPVLPIKSATVCGLTATELQSPKSYYVQQVLRRRQKLCDSASPTKVRMVVSHDPNLDPQAGAVACKVLGLPMPPAANLGFPLSCSYTDMDNSPHFMLKTVAVKKTSFRASEFELPPGYKRVNEAAELLADPERDQELTEFLQEGSKHH